jgi:hypothetical protein
MYGMLAFALLEVGNITEAEHFARLALSIEVQDIWAQHAVCHVTVHFYVVYLHFSLFVSPSCLRFK